MKNELDVSVNRLTKDMLLSPSILLPRRNDSNGAK